MKEIEMMNPIGVPKATFISLAPRVDSLEGKTVGLLSNGKPNAMPILESVGKLLSQRYPLAGIVKLNRADKEGHYYSKPMGKADQDLVNFVNRADVVISGIGD